MKQSDRDLPADREPAPVFIQRKQPAGRDHLEKVKRFYRQMDEQARQARLKDIAA